jgi:hypothetical protein
MASTVFGYRRCEGRDAFEFFLTLPFANDLIYASTPYGPRRHLPVHSHGHHERFHSGLAGLRSIQSHVGKRPLIRTRSSGLGGNPNRTTELAKRWQSSQTESMVVHHASSSIAGRDGIVFRQLQQLEFVEHQRYF